MALDDLLAISREKKKVGLSKERALKVLPELRQYISYFREYPDLFIDFLQTGFDPEVKKKLVFYYYQRVKKGS